MKNIKEANIQELLSANNGIVTTRILTNSGLSSRNIKRLVDDGFIEKIKLGYTWKSIFLFLMRCLLVG